MSANLAKLFSNPLNCLRPLPYELYPTAEASYTSSIPKIIQQEQVIINSLSVYTLPLAILVILCFSFYFLYSLTTDFFKVIESVSSLRQKHYMFNLYESQDIVTFDSLDDNDEDVVTGATDEETTTTTTTTDANDADKEADANEFAAECTAEAFAYDDVIELTPIQAIYEAEKQNAEPPKSQKPEAPKKKPFEYYLRWDLQEGELEELTYSEKARRFYILKNEGERKIEAEPPEGDPKAPMMKSLADYIRDSGKVTLRDFHGNPFLKVYFNKHYNLKL